MKNVILIAICIMFFACQKSNMHHTSNSSASTSQNKGLVSSRGSKQGGGGGGTSDTFKLVSFSLKTKNTGDDTVPVTVAWTAVGESKISKYDLIRNYWDSSESAAYWTSIFSTNSSGKDSLASWSYKYDQVKLSDKRMVYYRLRIYRNDNTYYFGRVISFELAAMHVDHPPKSPHSWW